MSCLEDMFENLKTASLSSALEALSTQIVELCNIDVAKLTNGIPELSEMLDVFDSSVRDSLETLIFTLKNVATKPELKQQVTELFKEATEISGEISHTITELKTGNLDSWDTLKNLCSYILDITLKILVLWDDVKVDSLLDAIQTMQKILSGLYKTPLLDEIVYLYKEFASQLTKFSPSIRARANDLLQQNTRHEILICLHGLGQWARLFADALARIAKNPYNRHSRASKDFVVKELQLQLTELERLLTLPSTVTLSDSATHTSSFISAVDLVLGRLEQMEAGEIDALETNLMFILRHSMTVAKFSYPADREKITTTSQNVLAEFRSLQKCLENLESSQANVELLFDIVVDFIELLEQQVNHSLLRMMIENLSNGTEPLNHLIKRGTSKRDDSSAERSSNDLIGEVVEFDESVERILQTGFFALASTSDLDHILTVRCALSQLESVEAEIVPAVYSCYLNEGDTAAQGHLKFLWRIFQENCRILQDSLDSIADPAAFCHVAETVLTSEVKSLQVAENRNSAGNGAVKVYRILERCWNLMEHQDWSDAVMKKLGLAKFQLALGELKGACSVCRTDADKIPSVVKRAELALKYLTKVNDGLKEMREMENSEGPDGNSNDSLRLERSALNFPASIHGLPLDASEFPTRRLPEKSKLGRSVGRLSRNVGQMAGTELPAEKERLEQLADETQPWRTRTVLMESVESQQDPGEFQELSQTFDLTELLEEISNAASTLSSTQSLCDDTAASAVGTATPRTRHVTFTGFATPLSVSVGTPQRIHDLRVVMERLEFLRKQKC